MNAIEYMYSQKGDTYVVVSNAQRGFDKMGDSEIQLLTEFVSPDQRRPQYMLQATPFLGPLVDLNNIEDNIAELLAFISNSPQGDLIVQVAELSAVGEGTNWTCLLKGVSITEGTVQ